MPVNKLKRGSAYIMVLFAAIPILLAAFTALAVSVNSRNISARHTVFFGVYELASAANIFVMLDFQNAYLANREAAHKRALTHFEDIFVDDNEKSVNLPAGYVDVFRHYLQPMIWEHLELSFGMQGNVLTRQIVLNLGADHAFYGTMRVERASERIIFRAVVNLESDNIAPYRATVQGIIRWPDAAPRTVGLCGDFQIKNLDYFTPWVVELMRQ